MAGKPAPIRRNLSSSSYVPDVSLRLIRFPLIRRKTVSLSPLYMPHASTRQKTDYLSALYMQLGSKPQESLSPAALYSHHDTWGKGKGGAVRRKNTAKRGTTVIRRWKSGRKSNRELRRRGARCQAEAGGGSGAAGNVGRYQPRRRTHTTNFLVHTTMRAKTMRTERIRAGGMPSAA